MAKPYQKICSCSWLCKAWITLVFERVITCSTKSRSMRLYVLIIGCSKLLSIPRTKKITMFRFGEICVILGLLAAVSWAHPQFTINKTALCESMSPFHGADAQPSETFPDNFVFSGAGVGRPAFSGTSCPARANPIKSNQIKKAART